MSKKNESMNTIKRWMQDPEFKQGYEEGYRELVLSELLNALMENDHQSVRKLAKKVGISPTTIQNIRSGKSADIRLNNFINIAKVCGFDLYLEKNGYRIPVASHIV